MDDRIKTIYTKHPFTGEVAVHKHPFPQLPLFAIVDAHPALLVLQSFRFRLHHSTCEPGDILRMIIMLRFKHGVHPGFRKDWSWYWSKVGKPDGATAGVKRKALGDTNADNKRTRTSYSDAKVVHNAEKLQPSPVPSQRKRVRRPAYHDRPTTKLPTQMPTSTRFSASPLVRR